MPLNRHSRHRIDRQRHAMRIAAALFATALSATACSDRSSTAVEASRITTVAVQLPAVVRDGDVISLTAHVKDQFGRTMSGVPVQWSVLDPSIATITNAGLLTAFREGTTQVVAVAGDVHDRRTLQVTLHPVTDLAVAQSQLQIMAGVQYAVHATVRGLGGRVLLHRPLEWRSSDSTIARVSSTGLITAMAPGTATVTVSYGTLRQAIDVTVRGVATVYNVADLDGARLPAVVHDELIIRPDGSSYHLIERLEGGSVTLDGGYQVRLNVTVSERWELNGNVMERVMARRTETDRGTLDYHWLDGSARLFSERVGGLTHSLRDTNGGLLLTYRIGGTFTIWSLGLRAPQ